MGETQKQKLHPNTLLSPTSINCNLLSPSSAIALWSTFLSPAIVHQSHVLHWDSVTTQLRQPPLVNNFLSFLILFMFSFLIFLLCSFFFMSSLLLSPFFFLLIFSVLFCFLISFFLSPPYILSPHSLNPVMSILFCYICLEED